MCGSDHDVVAVQQRVFGFERFGRGDVETGGVDLAGVERVDQRLGVDHATAGGVDDDHAVLHPGERVGVEQVAGLVGERRVQGDHSALGEDRVEVDLFVLGDLDVRVTDDHPHVHRRTHARDPAADAPVPDNADGAPLSSIPSWAA